MPFAIVALRAEPYYRRQSVVDGLRALGYAVTIPHRFSGRDRPITLPESRDDILACWNLKQGYDERDAELFERRGGTVLVFENAYCQKYDKTRYAISVHGHCGAGWFPADLSVDRFTVLEHPARPWREAGDHILVCGQRGIGSKQMASPSGWGERMAATLRRRFPNREVRFRPHPGQFKPKVPLERDLEGAHACVIWSSSCGVLALTMGVPVFYDAPRWICSDAAHEIRHLTKTFTRPVITFEQVKTSLNRMAWGQWTPDEIASGEPFARMKAENWGVETWD